MIILDTTVISEVMRAEPDPGVMLWLETQALRQLATTSINLAEIERGLARLPVGRRRRELEVKFARFLVRGFVGRVFDFDPAAADIYGDLVVTRERMGRPLEGFDGLIAAIARSRGMPLATRNVGDFEGCGIDVISPWEG
jgi:predicted nucleic acid-binding protein